MYIFVPIRPVIEDKERYCLRFNSTSIHGVTPMCYFVYNTELTVFVFQFYRELGHQAGMHSKRQTRVTACLGMERLSIMYKIPHIWFKLEKVCYHRPRRLHIVFFIFLCVIERKVAVEIPSNCRTSNHKDSFTSLHEHSFTCFLKDKFISR